MKTAKALLIFSLLATPAFAQPAIQIVPQGAWPLCVVQGLPDKALFCAGYTPGTETYLGMIHSGNPLATAFRLRVTATMQDGSIVASTVTVDRADNSAGWTICPSLTFGGIVKSFEATVDELGPVGGIVKNRRVI